MNNLGLKNILGLIFLCVYLNIAEAAQEGQICSSLTEATTNMVDFINHHNGTVTHSTTGLIWKVCAEGQAWAEVEGNTVCSGVAQASPIKEAFDMAKNNNLNGGYAGYTDWRLPNMKELATLVEARCTNPAINSKVFPSIDPFNDPYGVFWSSTPLLINNPGEYIYAISFYDGGVSFGLTDWSYNTRLVRHDNQILK